MTTNLLIGYPQIILDAPATVSANGMTPAYNLTAGSRSDYAQSPSAVTSSTITYDLGTAATRAIDFFYVAKAGVLKAQGSRRIGLEGSTDNVSYSPIAFNSSGFQSVTLYGPDSDDLIFTSELAGYTSGALPDSTSYRYYRVHFAGSGSCPSKRYAASKVIFGQWFNFGRDPEWSGFDVAETNWGARPPYRFQFTWQGITPAVKNSAESLLFSRREDGLILYTRNYHAPLLDYRAIHAYIKDYTMSPISD